MILIKALLAGSGWIRDEFLPVGPLMLVIKSGRVEPFSCITLPNPNPMSSRLQRTCCRPPRRPTGLRHDSSCLTKTTKSGCAILAMNGMCGACRFHASIASSTSPRPVDPGGKSPDLISNGISRGFQRVPLCTNSTMANPMLSETDTRLGFLGSLFQASWHSAGGGRDHRICPPRRSAQPPWPSLARTSTSVTPSGPNSTTSGRSASSLWRAIVAPGHTSKVLSDFVCQQERA